MASTLLYVGLSVGVSYLMNRYLAEEQETDTPFDDKPTPLAKHGMHLPLILGRRRVAPIFAWAGDRSTTVASQSTGKGDVFSGPTISVVTYHERAWHLLCIGPADAITAIVANGDTVSKTRYTPGSYPSGTQVSLGSFGDFRLSWGEDTQPIDPLVSARVVASRFPRITSLSWGTPGGSLGKTLGQSANWPSMEFDVEVRVNDSPLKASSAWLAESAGGLDDVGVNPAHALWQLLTKPYPYGSGIDESKIDFGALEALGELCEDEHIAANILLSGGVPIRNAVSWILADISATFPQIGEILSFIPIRPDPTRPTLSRDLILPPRPGITLKHGRRKADKLIFVFKDQRNSYDEQDIAVDDDGAADQYGVPKARKISLDTITHPSVAASVVDRRQQEELVPLSAVSFGSTRGARVLLPGQAFDMEDLGTLRLMSKKIDDLSNRVELEAAFDFYTPGASAYTPPTPSINLPEYDAEPDDPWTFFELPFAIAPAQLAIGVLRIRANEVIQNARVWLSATGTTYQNSDNQDRAAAGGELDEAWPASANAVTEQGPEFTAANEDIVLVQNLTGDEENWLRGRQILVLHDETADVHEICYLRNVTALGGDTYRLDGIIRARYDTFRHDFPAGTKVYIFEWGDIVRIVDPLIVLETDLYAKNQPYTIRREVDISGETPVVRTITGRSFKPLPTDNFRGNDDGSHPVNEYSTGGDILFEWTYRVKDGAGDAASEQLAGTAISPTNPTRDGFFRLEIIDPSGPTVVRTFDIESDTGQQNYTNAQLVSDFSGEPATFDARLTNIEGAYLSEAREITVTKV